MKNDQSVSSNKQLKLAVIGLGKTGLSVLAFLKEMDAHLVAFDTRAHLPNVDIIQQQYPAVELRLGALKSGELNEFDELIVSPGVPVSEPAIQQAIDHGVSVVGDVELFCRQAQAPIIAITGSNAKSTVSTWIAELCEAAGKSAILAGNIGYPVLEALSVPVPDYYVLELSSFQLETTYSLNAEIALLLNITPDHMDRYDSFLQYAAVKERIFSNGKWLVSNRADELTLPSVERTGIRLSFGLDEPADSTAVGIQGGRFVFAQQALCDLADLPSWGQHMLENALAVACVSVALQFPKEALKQALSNFKGLKHRCEHVKTIHGVSWYNDSKGTNVGAAIAAISSLHGRLPTGGRLVLLAGGVGKGADFTVLGKTIQQKVARSFLFGESANQIAETLLERDYEITESLEEAVSRAYEWTQSGDVVLLSPACASFDMFNSYEHRGDVFVASVQALLPVLESES